VKLIVVAGFLGSGKTTLILSLALELSGGGDKKVAIIENEIGQTGIDQKYLRWAGMKVVELQSGCVCCELQYDLIHTIHQIRENYSPDIIILEPSGVANAENILELLKKHHVELAARRVLVLVDAVRYWSLREKLPGWIEDSVKSADIVLINKIDEIEDSDLLRIRTDLERLTPGPKMSISARQGTGLHELLKEI
jgi:G3E family GTPase